MSERLVRLVERALALPGINQWRRSAFENGFQGGRHVGVCRGVYRTFEEARAAAPASAPIGYDHEGPASMYRDRIDHVFSSDYPMLLWLSKIFASGSTHVLDLGGHVGISYYAYQRLIDFPASLSWKVLDVPAVAAAGRELATTLDARGALSFVSSFSETASADLLFTAGCIQYLERTLAEQLVTLPKRPEWVLVNLLPLHPRETYWTVQSIGTAFCPYRVECRADFFDAMNRAGYETLDIWENPDKMCLIKFDEAHTIRGYAGAAFRLRDG